MTRQTTSGDAILRLRQFVTALLDLADRAFAKPIKFDESDHLVFMALSFAGKQVIHARSILTLQRSLDTTLVARSMFEGLSQLLWAAQDPTQRPERWRAFAFVWDWRQVRKQLREGIPVRQEQIDFTERGLRQYADRFLTMKAKNARAAGHSLPEDPYVMNWYGEKEREIFTAVDGDIVYRELYGPFSEWHHWRIGGFGALVRFNQTSGGFVFNLGGEDPAMTETALASAFQCLLQTLQAVEEIAHLGIAAELIRLRDRYIGGQSVSLIKLLGVALVLEAAKFRPRDHGRVPPKPSS